jgi:hypothetical protein
MSQPRIAHCTAHLGGINAPSTRNDSENRRPPKGRVVNFRAFPVPEKGIDTAEGSAPFFAGNKASL